MPDRYFTFEIHGGVPGKIETNPVVVATLAKGSIKHVLRFRAFQWKQAREIAKSIKLLSHYEADTFSKEIDSFLLRVFYD